jgi:hypothetical protein
MPAMRSLHVRPPTLPPPPRFPLRTLLLMVLTLGAFLHFYWRTHRPAGPPARDPGAEVRLQATPGNR